MCCSSITSKSRNMAASNDNGSRTPLHSSSGTTILPAELTTAAIISPTTTGGRRRLKQHHHPKQRRQQQLRNKTKKTVRFAKFDVTYDIPHSNDLTDIEFDSVWYSLDEIKQIRKEACSIVKRMMTIQDQGDGDDNHDLNGYCCRGLEEHTAEYRKKRMIINDFLMDAVIHRLQPLKKNKVAVTTHTPDVINVVDTIDQVISDLCSKYSACAIETAYYRAKQDEEEAMAIYYYQ